MRKALFLSGLFFVLLLPKDGWAEGKYYVFVYGGKFSPTEFRKMPFKKWHLKDECLAAMAVGKELWAYRDRLALELEAQIVKHWGEQDDYQEYVAAFNLRWKKFPWNNYLKTTSAFGQGLSYTDTVPDQEKKVHRKSAHLLNYLMYEVEAILLGFSRWSLVFRVHHRSGIFGLMKGVDGASNYPCLGIKYKY